MQNLLIYVPPSTNIFTAWMPRGADNAVFSYELIDNPANVTVKVYEKNLEDSGDGTARGEAFDQVSGGIYWKEFTQLEELVRFQISTGTSGVLYRIFPPTWFTRARV